jgi:hypothetical protein
MKSPSCCLVSRRTNYYFWRMSISSVRLEIHECLLLNISTVLLRFHRMHRLVFCVKKVHTSTGHKFHLAFLFWYKKQCRNYLIILSFTMSHLHDVSSQWYMEYGKFEQNIQKEITQMSLKIPGLMKRWLLYTLPPSNSVQMFSATPLTIKLHYLFLKIYCFRSIICVKSYLMWVVLMIDKLIWR